MAWIVTALPSFLASAVETVEALTVVLAVGLTRGWRSALLGTGAALLVLAGLVAILGPALSIIPIDVLRLVVGALLLIFGLQWLRKAILRASGYKPLHDEQEAFQAQITAAEGQSRPSQGRLDPYAFTLSFKSVLLEGLEVAFIVITFGAAAGQMPAAIVGAASAVVLTVAVGVAVKGPLARVPENWIKFVVGLLLTSFGTFWGAEGAGISWPGSDPAILGLLAVYSLVSWGYVQLLRQSHAEEQALRRLA
ncbi:MAG TPA: hypothetical protein VF221_16985 [Chloroflexota bacterium]